MDGVRIVGFVFVGTGGDGGGGDDGLDGVPVEGPAASRANVRSGRVFPRPSRKTCLYFGGERGRT